MRGRRRARRSAGLRRSLGRWRHWRCAWSRRARRCAGAWRHGGHRRRRGRRRAGWRQARRRRWGLRRRGRRLQRASRITIHRMLVVATALPGARCIAAQLKADVSAHLHGLPVGPKLNVRMCFGAAAREALDLVVLVQIVTSAGHAIRLAALHCDGGPWDRDVWGHLHHCLVARAQAVQHLRRGSAAADYLHSLCRQHSLQGIEPSRRSG